MSSLRHISWYRLCGVAIAIALLAVVNQVLIGEGTLPLLVTPFAASAALLFLSPHSEASRPRVLCGGIVISAVVGVAVTEMVHPPAIAAPIAVVASIVAMSLTRCEHPPGAAIALTAVVGNDAVHEAGFHFVLFPIALDSALLIAIHRSLNLIPLPAPRTADPDGPDE